MNSKCYKVVFLCSVLFCQFGYAQDWRFQVGDEWFNNHQGLKVGDTLPDIPLGNIVNNYTGKTKFSDFRGKLVILDMWNTTCKTCIARFPHMEELQKHFGDKIQIFIVNPYQTQGQIDNAWKTFEPVKNKKLPNLPSITGPTILAKLFPARFVPHHVWIDGKGIVRLIGDDKNTYEEKINELLAGQKIKYMNSSNNTPLFNKNFPYYKVIGEQIKPGRVNSFFTPFNNEYQVTGNVRTENEYDSAANTMRNTYVNNTIFDLYSKAYFNDIVQEYKRILFVANTDTYAQTFVKDSTLFFPPEWPTDVEFMQRRYCYELITPSSFTEQRRRKVMQQDLNREFGKLFHFHASIETRSMLCYVLVFKNGKNKLSSKQTNFKEESLTEDGVKLRKYSGASFPNILTNSIIGQEFIRGLNGQPFILLDETGYKGKADLILPERDEIKNLSDLKRALQRNNLDIIKTERNINSIVIRQK